MLRGLYTATAGMISQQRKHDTITNNISNLNTPGFKQGNAVSRSFPEMLISLVGGTPGSGATTAIGRLNTGVLAEEDLSIYLQGDLQETKNPFDLALTSNIQMQDPAAAPGTLLKFDGSGKAFDGDGQKVFQPQAFFTVRDRNNEQRYTRNGKFTANEAGELVTPDGFKVLGVDNQPIVLRDNATGEFISEAKIASNGAIVDARNGAPFLDANGQQMRLLISRVDNPNRLIREGNGVYRVNPGEEGLVSAMNLQQDGQVTVSQGYLERSNVDPTQSVIDMNAALRAYEANQKMVQYYDRSLDKAVNEVGRV